MKSSLIPLCLLLSLQPAVFAQSGADADWGVVVELDRPPTQSATSREAARRVGLAHLGEQESALRQFLARHPRDPRALDALLRLAHLYTIRADFSESTADLAAAQQVLAEAEKSAPPARRADVAFARLSLSMRGLQAPTDQDRQRVSDAIHKYQRAFPNDRRIAALLVELANLYDHHPKQKERYLSQALQAARSEEMRARVMDDLKRLALLSKPIAVKGKGPDGRAVSSVDFKGRIVLVYFVASWSPPSIAGMEEVNRLRSTFPEGRVTVIGVSMDQTPESFAATRARAAGNWHWIVEPKAWDSPMIRSFGINALPLLWIIDRQGRLRTLNARSESDALIRSLLREN